MLSEIQGVFKTTTWKWVGRVCEKSPFYGINYVCGITLTFGGPLTDKYAHVLDLEGEPIPGLYAVGELTGGFFFENYPGGGSLARCAVFGRIAGEHVASIVKS